MELGMSEYQLGVKVHRCGAVVQDGEKFCASCGWPLMNIPDDIKAMSDMLDTVIASVKGADTSVLGLAHAAYVMGWDDALRAVRDMDLLSKPIATKTDARATLEGLRAREEARAAEDIEEFYGPDGAPLPDGVVPAALEDKKDD